MNFALNEFPGLSDIPITSAFTTNKDRISFICKFTDNVSVAVRLSADGRLAYRTMYPLRDS